MSVFKTTATATEPQDGGGRKCSTVHGFAFKETAGGAARVRLFGGALPVPTAPTAVDSAVAGVITAGDHYLTVTYYTEDGETELGAAGVLSSAGTLKASVTNIPVYTGPGAGRVLGRRLYMTEAAGGTYYRVADLAGNVTTTATVDVADAQLTALPASPTENLSGVLYVDCTLVADELRYELLPVPLNGLLLRSEIMSGAVTTFIYGK
jgi:hypothetical protein